MYEGLVTKRSCLLPLRGIPLSCTLSKTSSKPSPGPHSIPTSPPFEVEWDKLIEAIYLLNMKGIPIAIVKAERKREKTMSKVFCPSILFCSHCRFEGIESIV